MGVLENKTEAKDELVTETIETEATETSDPVVQPAETETSDPVVQPAETETVVETIEAGPDAIESESNVVSIEAENSPVETIEKEVLEPLDVVEAPTETEDTEKSN